MEINAILQSVAAIPSLSVRPFLAAFVVAMFASWGYAGAVPAWFIAQNSLIIMGILAALEVGARKDPDIRMFLDEVDGILKAGVSVLISYTLVDAESAALMMTLTGDSVATTSVVPTIVSGVWSTVTAVGTWFISGFRKLFIEPFIDADEDDDLGVQGIFSWGEDIFAVGGVGLAILLPLVAIVLFLVTLLGLYIVQKMMERRTEKSKIACVHCQESIYPTATICHHCKNPNPRPVQTGYFGQPNYKPAVDYGTQRFHLATRKLCPSCATRLKAKAVQQSCPTCGTKTFKSAEAVDDYLVAMEKKLPETMIIAGLFGLIPVVGMVPGIIYYRLSLIAGVRRYVPRRTGCLTRWGVRLLNLLILLFQPVPLLGALTLPTMCYVNFQIYKKVLQREGYRELRGEMPASLSLT